MNNFKCKLCIVVRNTLRTLPVAGLSVFMATLLPFGNRIIPVVVGSCFSLFVCASIAADIIHERNRKI